jgi:hypothetical protein
MNRISGELRHSGGHGWIVRTAPGFGRALGRRVCSPRRPGGRHAAWQRNARFIVPRATGKMHESR